MMIIPSSLDEMIFEIIDRCKLLFFPEKWNSFFMSCSKNEVFLMLLVYRRSQVNMTEISEYLHVPLNTVTGMAGRLEKRNYVFRERNKDDKRVVTISLTDTGRQFMKDEMTILGSYFQVIMEALTEEEKTQLFQIAERIFTILAQKSNTAFDIENQEKRMKRIIIE